MPYIIPYGANVHSSISWVRVGCIWWAVKKLEMSDTRVLEAAVTPAIFNVIFHRNVKIDSDISGEGL